MLTPEEVAADLRLKTTTVYEYLKDGRIEAIKLGSRWRIEETALTDFKNKHRQRANKYGFSPRSARSEAAIKAARTRNK